MLVAGGCIVEGCTTATTSAAIVTANSVSPTAPMRTARDAHTATLLNDGTVVVVGGFSAEGEPPIATAERYSPETATWTAAGELQTARGGHTAALLGSGTLLVAGGWVSSRTYTSTIELLDPQARSFRPGPELPEAVDGLASIALPDGRVLVTGGQRSPGVASDMAALVSAEGSAITALAPLNHARFKHAMVLLADGRVLVVGGTSDDTTLLTSTEVFDPQTLAFSPGPSLAAGRYKLAGSITSTSDGSIVVGGGGAGVEILDVGEGTTAFVEGAPTGVSSFGTVTAADGYLYFIGGYDEHIALRGTFAVLPEP